MYETLTLDVDDRGVARLCLARPEKHNAMSGFMLEEIASAVSDISGRADIRVVVLTGQGKSFCAGGDLAWMRAQFDMASDSRRKESAKIAIALQALDHLPQPLIGAIQGNAFGGGLGLISVCDTVVAVDTVRFGFTETRLGVIPANIAPFVLRRMGPGPARRVLMSSRVFDAQDALSLGLVTKIVTQQTLAQAVEDEIAPYLACAPGAVAETKALLRALGHGVPDEQIQMAIEALARRWQSQEAQTGIAAFFAKKTAPWVQNDT
ncbi:MAG: crotonase/enoyl-CoA hydratase family protein [Marinovum sp.]|nr:crotonase/enoyl-CoA hydratase family protein [Marinovum sp.]